MSAEAGAGRRGGRGGVSIALAYLALFRGYGLNLDDEGTLLAPDSSAWRTARCRIATSTSATRPATSTSPAAAWRLAGVLPPALLLALVHAAPWRLSSCWRPGSPRDAGVGGRLLVLAFIQVFPGRVRAFNIPYPAWLATTAWVGWRSR